jgi:hypothetical protein
LLNDEWVIDEIKEEIKRFLEVNENENTTLQNLYDTANTKKTYKESMKQKACSLKKINKIDRSLANLNKMRREKTQISKIRKGKEEITTNTMKHRKSSETTLRAYTLINLKVLKKWTDFYKLITTQN